MLTFNTTEMSLGSSRTGRSNRTEAEADGAYVLPRKQRTSNHCRLQDSRGKNIDQQAQPATIIYAATYSGVPVYEMMSRGVAVMRRKADSYLNATQILKVAGIEKGRRTKILEREILQGEHEKVQGGYGKYQGTWVPFKRGMELAEQYAVDHFLRPLFLYNPHADGSATDNTPTKDQLKSRESAGSPYNKIEATNADHGTRKRRRTEEGPFGSSTNLGEFRTSGNEIPAVQCEESPYQPSPPPKQPSPNADKHRAMLMAMFLNEDASHVPDMLVGSEMPPDLDLDMVVDDQGHTAVHWAAALSRLKVLQHLVEKGADMNHVNFMGETALDRAVLVTNNFDTQCFPRLLEVLHGAIPVCDKKARTVLHHIVLTAGIKGRATSANYYMACLLEWISQNGGNFTQIVDLQDKNGDTALNIAARIGNQSLIDQLVNVGANRFIENKVGLKPEDFGVEGKSGEDGVVRKESKRDLDDKENVSSAPIDGQSCSADKRTRDVISAVQAVIFDVEENFAANLSSRKEELSKTQQNLRASTRELAVLRREIAALRTKHDAFADVRLKKAALEQAVDEEDAETRQLLASGQLSEDILATDMLAPDAAEKVLSGAIPSVLPAQPPVTSEASTSGSAGPPSPPSCSGGDQSLINEVRTLRARVDAYHHNSAELRSQIARLQEDAAERESQCKRLIATCCNVTVESVDSLFGPLMQAVDADGPDIDLSRVARFLSCIQQEEGVRVPSQQ